MVKTLEEWDKLARARYLKFAKNPDCKKCPLGFDSLSGTNFYRPYQSIICDLYDKDTCCCCHHILRTSMGCPCFVYGKDEAFKRLLTWTEGL